MTIQSTERVMNRLVISSKLFHWHRGIREFSTEASCLEHEMIRQGRRANQLERRRGSALVEAQEWGFWMKSHKTGREVWFMFIQEHRRQGELLSVEFRAADLDVRCVVDND
jgi:hypothetical protein